MVEFTVPNFINLLAFIGLTIATYTIFYFGKTMSPKGIGTNLFTLALGINLIGLSHLFRIWLDILTSPLVLILVATGAMFLSTGIIWVVYEKSMEINNLKKREREINSTIAKLKEKYYQKELSEEDLKVLYSNLMKELTEIEVGLTERRK